MRPAPAGLVECLGKPGLACPLFRFAAFLLGANALGLLRALPLAEQREQSFVRRIGLERVAQHADRLIVRTRLARLLEDLGNSRLPDLTLGFAAFLLRADALGLLRTLALAEQREQFLVRRVDLERLAQNADGLIVRPRLPGLLESRGDSRVAGTALGLEPFLFRTRIQGVLHALSQCQRLRVSRIQRCRLVRKPQRVVQLSALQSFQPAGQGRRQLFSTPLLAFDRGQT